MKIYQKIIQWFFIVLIGWVIFSLTITFIADIFFDNAAKKDTCADGGGAWNYTLDQCQSHPNDQRSKR